MSHYRNFILQRRKSLDKCKKARFKNEAVRICQVAAKEFNFKIVYLFGSTINARPLSVWSDIDLVFKGFPEEEYYTLVGFLCSESRYKMDIKLYEYLKPEIRDIIHAKGVKIYGP